MIREKPLQERVAMQFASAGLGARSAREAARLLCGSGVSFETAAVMGQLMDEPCTATPAKIREAADRFRRLQEGPPSASAWGRPVQEASAPDAAAAVASTPSEPVRSKTFVHEDKTVVIKGVPHQEVVEYQPLVSETAVEESPRRSAWGRNVEG